MSPCFFVHSTELLPVICCQNIVNKLPLLVPKNFLRKDTGLSTLNCIAGSQRVGKTLTLQLQALLMVILWYDLKHKKHRRLQVIAQTGKSNTPVTIGILWDILPDVLLASSVSKENWSTYYSDPTTSPDNACTYKMLDIREVLQTECSVRLRWWLLGSENAYSIEQWHPTEPIIW